MKLLRRALLPVVIGLISNTMVARADLADEYNVEQSVSFKWAQFEVDGSPHLRYHILKNGDIYKIGPNPFCTGYCSPTSIYKVGNLNETRRFLGSIYTCKFCYTQVEYRTEDCKLYAYSRHQYTVGGEFGMIKREHIATCRIRNFLNRQ